MPVADTSITPPFGENSKLQELWGASGRKAGEKMQFPKVMRLTLSSLFDDRPDVGERLRDESDSRSGATSRLCQGVSHKSVKV